MGLDSLHAVWMTFAGVTGLCLTLMAFTRPQWPLAALMGLVELDGLGAVSMPFVGLDDFCSALMTFSRP